MLLEIVIAVVLIVGIMGLLLVRNTLLSVLLKKNKKRERHVAFQTAENKSAYQKDKITSK